MMQDKKDIEPEPTSISHFYQVENLHGIDMGVTQNKQKKNVSQKKKK